MWPKTEEKKEENVEQYGQLLALINQIKRQVIACYPGTHSRTHNNNNNDNVDAHSIVL